MDIRRLKDTLRQTGTQMLDLADRLDKNGKPLESWEKTIVRTGMIPAVKERLDIILLEYVTGAHPGVLEEFDID